MLKILLINLLLIHPVHVSMSSMEIMPDENAYLFTLRMYSDDLLMDINDIFNICNKQIDDNINFTKEDRLQDYANYRMKFIINGEAVKAELISIENLEMETLMLFQIPFVERVEEIEVHNQILTALYPDQVNLFIYRDENIEKAIKFTSEHLTEKLVLEEE